MSFGVNFDILLNKNIQKRIIFIYNNDIAAARVELWSFSTIANYALHSAWKAKKNINEVSFKKCYSICSVFMVDIKIRYCLNYFNKEIEYAIA